MNDKPWLNAYPAGMRWDIDIEDMALQQILDDALAKWPDNPALEFMGRTLSYRELGGLVDRAAKGLQELGVKPGVHVGLYLPNSPHYVIAFFAVLKAGGTLVNYSPLDAARVLEHKIEDSQTDFLFTLDLASLYPQMAGMLGTTRLKKLIVGNLAEMAAQPEAVAAQLQAARQLADVTWDERHVPFAGLLENDGQYTPYPVDDPAETIAVLQYTGGTTGLPKGAMLTHRNLVACCAQCFEACRGEPNVLEEGQERILVVLPLFHVYALTANMLSAMRLGAHVILHLRFDPKAALQEISGRQITGFWGVPTMFTALIEHPEASGYSLRSLKCCGSGGAPLPVELAHRFKEITGCTVTEGWGMTETGATGAFTPVRGTYKPGSCGIPMPGVEIRMLSLEDARTYVPLGEKGEICIKGPNVMKGYWKREDATAKDRTAEGFMRTGDVGYMDEDGYVFIVDRTKDMLLCSGFNVYPRVLEEAIYQHPSVSEVCVIGIPDEYRGQSPKAFIVLKAGARPFELRELQDFLKDRLGKHEMVHAMELRTELPKTPVGKISKKDLVEEEAQKRAATA